MMLDATVIGLKKNIRHICLIFDKIFENKAKKNMKLTLLNDKPLQLNLSRDSKASQKSIKRTFGFGWKVTGEVLGTLSP